MHRRDRAEEKRRRQAAIEQIVREHEVANQEALVALLQESGFEVTQASVSRDVRELGLVKADGRYTALTSVAAAVEGAVATDHSELITGFEPVGANLVVVHTAVGAAGAVAVDLDARFDQEIAGTIAGDDAIFVAVRSRAMQGRVIAELRAMATP